MTKLFKQEEVDKASLKNSKLHYIMAFSEDLHRDADMDFKAGIEFAESKVEYIAIEFADWINNNSYWFDQLARNKSDSKTLFQQFLKERNNG